MLRLMRPVLLRTPVPSAAIARDRLKHAICADRVLLESRKKPANDLLGQLLGEPLADEGRAA